MLYRVEASPSKETALYISLYEQVGLLTAIITAAGRPGAGMLVAWVHGEHV
jgi:hypothetical protein